MTRGRQRIPILSVTGRARLLNGLLSAAALSLLVPLADARIHGVLYDSVDSVLRERATLRVSQGVRNQRQGRHNGPPDRDGETRDAPRHGGPFDEDGPPFEGPPRNGPPPRGEPKDGDGPPDFRPGEPPSTQFGALALRPPRYFLLSNINGNLEVWSQAGFDTARSGKNDLRDARDTDGTHLRVLSLAVWGTQGRAQPPVAVVQAAATLTETDAALHGIRRALYALLVPLVLGTGVLGALLTNVALAPVKRLNRAVQNIGAENLSARLPAPGGGDSFDRLVGLLNAMLTRLDDAFTRQKRFTADASHELRTPLAVIKAGTSLLLENSDELTSLQKRVLTGADHAANRANRLISDLLLLARTQNGSLPVHLSRVNLYDALANAASEAQTFHAAPHAAVHLETQTNLETQTDPDHLHRILVNLLTNALRHTPASGAVTITAQLSVDTLKIRVRDTGEGMAPDVLARVGEAFFRPDTARDREQGGAGLGLAIAQGLIQSLNGTLHLSSVPGEGTTVTVRLPAA